MTGKIQSNRAGMTLIEVIIGLALLGTVGIGFLTALSTGISTTAKVDERVMAINLARSQLEDIKLRAYTEPPVYTAAGAPDGYTVTVTGTTLTPNLLQKIRVSVAFNGAAVSELEGFKVNR